MARVTALRPWLPWGRYESRLTQHMASRWSAKRLRTSPAFWGEKGGTGGAEGRGSVPARRRQQQGSRRAGGRESTREEQQREAPRALSMVNPSSV